MSNFKSNNRFSFLGEEKNNLEPIKSQSKISFREKEREYDNKPKYNQFKKYNSTPVPPKKEFEIKEDEFPDLLISIPIKINSNNIKSFASLLEKKDEKEEKDEDEIIPPGWCFYKYTKLKNGFTTEFIKPFINYEILEEKIELNEAEEITNALSILHEKRTNEYKELWGEDEYNYMFVFPNHDYEYFDKLDEAYDIERFNFNEKYYNDDDDY